jgi:tRNA(His) 5'-end guanylyltransferase
MKNSDLGTRMKSYENINRYYLTRRMPLIVRVDGKAFHSYTKNFKKPYDEEFVYTMVETGKALLKEIQGSKLVYIQSDEISILATDYKELNTQAWFDKNLQKMVSVSASIATAYFNDSISNDFNKTDNKIALFDSRVFVLPKEEVNNYFLWQQQDATRNSIQGLGQFHFSHKELTNLNCNQIQEKLFQEKHINWNDIETWKKRGICLYKTQATQVKVESIEDSCVSIPIIRTKIITDREIPIFSQQIDYVEKWL